MQILDTIRERIACRFPLLFLSTWEEDRWESELASLALDMGRGLVTWTATSGAAPRPDNAASAGGNVLKDPLEMLAAIPSYPREHIFLLKDFHPWLDDPTIQRLIRDLIPRLAEQDKTLLFMGPEQHIPRDLRTDAISLTLPLPGLAELREELREVLIARQHAGEARLSLNDHEEERLLKTLLGLTRRQARQSMSRALLGRHRIDDDVYAALVAEKKHMVQGSDLLEFQTLSDSVKDIGGLEALKAWIGKRAEAFSERARQQGIPSPKGVLLLGVQGCGKSLTARAIARILAFPLVRLDISTLLSSDRGGSEKNLRDVLNLLELIAPAVLWMDEVEKGFAGVSDESGGDPTMVRLMGRLLTWMQEKPAPVFVVATANSVTGLPPEMLRRGRFDELFFVDLPNYHERRQILSIHLEKRGLGADRFNTSALAEITEGYSGAELEQAVLTSMVETFNSGATLTQRDLETALEETVPLSVTMEEKIFQLREWARTRCRPATPDSRVLQMLEQEQRDKAGSDEPAPALNLLDDDDLPDNDEAPVTWKSLLAAGEVRTALYEYVSEHNRVTFTQIAAAFGPHVEFAGDFGVALRTDPNVVLWVGMSADVAAPLARLISERRLFVEPAASGSYADSDMKHKLPRLPGLSDTRVSRPCWLPVTLSATPPDEVDERLTRVARMKLNR